MWHFTTLVVEPTPLIRPPRWADLRSDEAEKIIREWSRDTNRVIITEHAFERIDERSTLENHRYADDLSDPADRAGIRRADQE